MLKMPATGHSIQPRCCCHAIIVQKDAGVQKRCTYIDLPDVLQKMMKMQKKKIFKDVQRSEAQKISTSTAKAPCKKMAAKRAARAKCGGARHTDKTSSRMVEQQQQHPPPQTPRSDLLRDLICVRCAKIELVAAPPTFLYKKSCYVISQMRCRNVYACSR